MKSILKIEVILSLVAFLILIFIAFNFNITGNSGDSINHYLFSHYSFKYPLFFFDHWAKPLFVLLSAPFSQFGFKGIIVFNIICAIFSAIFTFYIAKKLKLKHAYLVFIFIFFSPLYFKLIFSGLTEYLFGLFLILGIYFYQNKKYLPALIIISFLPLIRSEGLLIIGVFAIYSLLNKQIKVLPYLFTGQLIYTIIGAFFYKDILWVINEIPYASLGSPYGKGELLDFVHRLNYTIEKPIYFLLVIGCLSIVFTFFKSDIKKTKSIQLFIILGSFVTFFVAHTIFWWQGIFNSMGLPRVLIAIVPIIAIISLIGFETILKVFNKVLIQKIIVWVFILLIVIYPFTNRPEGVVFNKEIFIVNDNNLIKEELNPFIKNNLSNYTSTKLYFSHPYISLALGIDPFDKTIHREIQYIQTDNMVKGNIIIWDDWYSLMEGKIELEELKKMRNLQFIKSFERKEKNRLIQFYIFKQT